MYARCQLGDHGSNKMSNGNKVIVGLSGGVDSAVAAAILKQKGYNVIGVTLSLLSYTKEDSVGCCSFNDTIDATKVCDLIGIEHLVVSRRKNFKAQVIDPFVSGHKQGVYHNPCITCNNTVKIPTLINFAKHLGASHVATGHYARIIDGKIAKGKDGNKDQSYFLWELSSKEITDHLMFPLGDMTKVEVRAIAENMGLPVAAKKDSTNLCFLEGGTKAEFLAKHDIHPQKGNVLDGNGNVVGTHDGVHGFIPGQRLPIQSGDGKAKFVLKVIPDTNTILMGSKDELLTDKVAVHSIKWTDGAAPKSFTDIKAVCRYRQAPIPVEGIQGDTVFLGGNVYGATPGQSIVFYKGDCVIGGGIIN